MSKTQNPNEQADLSTPNAQEFLTSATSKSGKPTILVNYPALLKASGDDKALAYSRLKNTDSVNFDFGILDHELGGDSAAAFDALASQNAVLAGYKSEDEKKQKTAARAKFAENLAKSTDANADYLTQKKAQAAVYDYIGTQGFNEDESEAQSAYKSEIIKPFYKDEYEKAKKGVGFAPPPPVLSEQDKAFYDEQAKQHAEWQKLTGQRSGELLIGDIEGARDERYTDDEIKEFLKQDENSQKREQKSGSFADFGNFVQNIREAIDPTKITDFLENHLIWDNDKVDNKGQAQVLANLRQKAQLAREHGRKLTKDDLDLQEQYQAYLRAYDEDSLLGKAKTQFSGDKKHIDSLIQKGIDIMEQEEKIAQTPYDKLSKDERKYLYKQAGTANRAWDRIFKDDDEEVIEQQYNITRGNALIQLASARAESLKNFAKTHNLVFLAQNYLSGSLDENYKREFEKFLGDNTAQAKDLGFDGADINEKGKLVYFKTDENTGIKQTWELDEGFFNHFSQMMSDNVGSIAGAILGTTAGLYYARKGRLDKTAKAIGATKAAIVGAAAGSMAGATSDYIANCIRLGKKPDFSEMIYHATQDGILSVAGDAAMLGLSKLGAKTAQSGIFNTLIKTPAAKTAEFADKAIEKFPILGAVTSPVRNFFKGNNISAAEDLVLKNFTKEQRAEIDTLLKEQGGGINLGTTERLQFAADKLTQKYGADSQIAKTAQNFVDAFNLKGFKERQSRLLQLVISDESGKHLGYLLEVAKNNPEVERQIENMVRYSTSHLKAALSKLDLPENQLKDIFNDFEKGTKESFGDAMRIIGDEFYPADIYKTKIDKTPFENLIKNANEQAIFTGEAEKRFLNEVITPLFDEKGVSFTQLANIRRNLNQYYKKLDSPTLKDFISGQVGAELRAAIDNGINDIFKQNPAAYAKIKALDETALRDYSAMKDIRGVLKKLNFYNEQTSFADDLDKLINFVLTGKGNEAVPNLERLLSKLTPENRAAAEINILNQILENAKVIYKRQYDGDSIETFHTFQFLDTLEALARRGNVFKSAPAQDFIKIVKDWHTLNKNHAVILSDLRPANVKEIRGSIATSIEGRLAQMRTNIIMSNMFRLLDKIPFISNISWNGSSIWDRTQASALRWHIKNALARSVTMDDFKLKVLERVDKGGFNNATKQILREIAQTAEQTEQNLAKMQDFEDAVLQKAAADETPTQNADDLMQNLGENSQGGSLLERARAANEQARNAAAEQSRLEIEQLAAEQVAQREAAIARQEKLNAAAGDNQLDYMAKNLQIGEDIPQREVGKKELVTDDYLENETGRVGVNVEYKAVKRGDLKPEFEKSTGLQIRGEKDQKMINEAVQNFNTDKFLAQQGTFEGSPIILKDGQIIAGNHRGEILQNLSEQDLKRYQNAVKEKFGIDLADDEVLVRVLTDDLSNDELIKLASLTNLQRAKGEANEIMSNVAAFSKPLDDLEKSAQLIQGENIGEMKNNIARLLDNKNGGRDIDKANKALFGSMVKNSTYGDLHDVIKAIDESGLDANQKVEAKQLFYDNAGNFYNLAHAEIPFDLRPFLNDFMAHTARIYAASPSGDTAKIMQRIADNIQALTAESTKINPQIFKDTITDIVGLSFRRFLSYENPSSSLFDFLKNISEEIERVIGYERTFLGRDLAQTPPDIYDLAGALLTYKKSGDDSLESATGNKAIITGNLPRIRELEQQLKADGVKFNKAHEMLVGKDGGVKWNGTAAKMDLSNPQSARDLKEFYARNSTSKTDDELFNRTLEAAQHLGVNVKFSDSVERSFYDPATNMVTIARKNSGAVQAEDLCHELIHAATEKGLRLYKTEPAIARQIFTDKQMQAFRDIDELYAASRRSYQEMSEAEFKAHLKDLQEKGYLPRDFDINTATPESFSEIWYGYNSVYEFVGELANPIFRETLKKQGIWETIKNCLVNFFWSGKPSSYTTFKTTSYEALRKRYYTILDEYKKPPTKTDIPPKTNEPTLFDTDLRLFAKARTSSDTPQMNLFGGSGKQVYDESSSLFSLDDIIGAAKIKKEIENAPVKQFEKPILNEQQQQAAKNSLFDDINEGTNSQVSQNASEVSHINQNDAIISPNLKQGGENASKTTQEPNGYEPTQSGVQQGNERLFDEPTAKQGANNTAGGASGDIQRGFGARQLDENLPSQEPISDDRVLGRERGTNDEDLRADPSDLRGEIRSDGQDMRPLQREDAIKRPIQAETDGYSQRGDVSASERGGGHSLDAKTSREVVGTITYEPYKPKSYEETIADYKKDILNSEQAAQDALEKGDLQAAREAFRAANGQKEGLRQVEYSEQIKNIDEQIAAAGEEHPDLVKSLKNKKARINKERKDSGELWKIQDDLARDNIKNDEIPEQTAEKIAELEKRLGRNSQKRVNSTTTNEGEVELKTSDNAAGALNPQQEAQIEIQRFTQTTDPANFSAREVMDANIKALETLDDLLTSGRLATQDEKEILSRFSGAGGRFSKMLHENPQATARVDELLKSLDKKIPKDQYDFLELNSGHFLASADNAYFTPLNIIKSMTDFAKKLGLKETSNILEPSAGVGRFLGFFDNPQRVYGVEMDRVTAAIAQKIYPNAHIQASAFEKSHALKNAGSFDLTIGNPPYSSAKIENELIHDYFMLKDIELLKENGISIQIVTHNFMDKDSAAKQAIAEQAEFLGGVRLPNTAFKGEAQVVTDILVFRKATPDEIAQGTLDKSWAWISDFDNGVKVSTYFKNNPQNVLGNTTTKTNQWENFVLDVTDKGVNLDNLDLSQFIKSSDQAFMHAKTDIAPMIELPPEKSGKIIMKDNEFYQNGEVLDIKAELAERGVDWAESTIDKLTKLYKQTYPAIEKVKTALADLLKGERDDLPKAELDRLRQHFNNAFDAMLGYGGSFYSQGVRKGLKDEFKIFDKLDDEAFEIFALMDKDGKKSDIFKKRVYYPYKRPDSADTLNEAALISLNETGDYNLNRIAELRKISPEQAEKEMLESKMIFKDGTGRNIPADEFLSGDVRTRLETFKDPETNLPKFSDDPELAAWQKIAYEELEKVIPPDVELVDISIPLGAGWLDPKILTDFIENNIGVEVKHIKFTNGSGWTLRLGNLKEGRNILDYLIPTDKVFAEITDLREINVLDYLENMLNLKTLAVTKSKKVGVNSHGGYITKTYTDKISSEQLEIYKNQLQTEFKDFIEGNIDHAILAQRQYNDTFNRLVLRKYDGSHLQFIGKNPNINLRTHQKNAVFRILTDMRTLLAHAVGTGKTYTMGAAAIEAKRMGIVSKPMITTPNNVAPQLAAELRQLYPTARIKLVQAVSKKTKKIQLSQLKTNDYDIIVCSNTAFEAMQVSREAMEKYSKYEIDALKKVKAAAEANGADKTTINGLAKRIKTINENLKEYIKQADEGKLGITFDELGVDMIMADEAHYFKNLPIFTKQTRVRGIGQARANRAVDYFMKIHNVRDNMKVVFATGTPITNYISDMFVLQKYLDPEFLKKTGMDDFDQWCNNFAQPKTQFELKATGTFEPTARLRDFINLPELLHSYLKFADVITKQDMKDSMKALGLADPEPPIKRQPIYLEQSKYQADYMEQIKARGEAYKEMNAQERKEKGADNYLKMISDANKASLDMRMIAGYDSLTRDPNGKIQKCADQIFDVYQRFTEYKGQKINGTQLVFLDKGTPKSKKRIKPEEMQKLRDEREKLQAEWEEKSSEQYDTEILNRVEAIEKRLTEINEKISMNDDSFSPYEDLKAALMEKGIKENEIAFIHDYNTPDAKLKLSQKINDGEIRVLIGSTAKMGAGSNFQKRLVALHNLDFDWTPANMEQRLGRIERQGNEIYELMGKDFNAEVYDYVTKQMSDSLMLQVLNAKEKIIKTIQSRDSLALRKIIDDSEDDLFQRMMANSMKNAHEHLELYTLDKTLQIARAELLRLENKARNAQNMIKGLQKQQTKITQIIECMERFKKSTEPEILDIGAFKFDLNDKKMNEKMNEAVKSIINNHATSLLAGNGGGVVEIGSIKGFKLIAKGEGRSLEGLEIRLYLGDDLNNAKPLGNAFPFKNVNSFTFSMRYHQQIKNNLLTTLNEDRIKKIDKALKSAQDSLDKTTATLKDEKTAKMRQDINDGETRLSMLRVFLGMDDETNNKFPEATKLANLLGFDGDYLKARKYARDTIKAEIAAREAAEAAQAQSATSRTASETAQTATNAQNLGENLAKNGENLSDLSENSAAQTQKNLIDEPQAQKAAPASEPKTDETATQNTAQTQPQKQGYTLQDALNYYDEFLTRLSDYFNEQVARGYMKEASAKRLMGKVKTMWKNHKGYFKDGYERNTEFGMPYLNSQSGEMEMQSAFARILANLEKVKMTKGNRLDISSFRSKNYYFLNLDELKAKGKPTKTADDEFRKNLLKLADEIDNGGGTSRTASETATARSADDLAQNLSENTAKQAENLAENSQKGENLSDLSENSAAQGQKNLIDEPQAQKAEPASEPQIKQTPAQQELRASLNETLQEAFDTFKALNKDSENDELFDKVISIANALDVRYWVQSNPRWVGGTFTYWQNRAMIDSKLLENIKALEKSGTASSAELDNLKNQAAKTLLHEHIHAVTSRAIHAYDNGLKNLLTKTQIEGIEELKNLYKVVKEKNKDKAFIDFGNSKKNVEENAGKDRHYGLMNEHEMLAELANKNFRNFLKKESLYTKIVGAIAKIFNYFKKDGAETATDALTEAKSALYKIMENYNPNFTKEFDDKYRQLDFVDFTNYKDYLKKHTQRVQNYFDFRKNDNYHTNEIRHQSRLAAGNGLRWAQDKDHNLAYLHLNPVFNIKSLDEISSKPLKDELERIIMTDEALTYNSTIHNVSAKDMQKYESDRLFVKNYTMIEGIKPLIKSGLYKQLDDKTAEMFLQGLRNIAQRENISYRGKTINDFFARDYAEKFIQKLNEGENSVNLFGVEGKLIPENAENSQAKEIQQKIQQKFGKDENYARDLYEWHKDSSPLTKDEDGTPKVFYHGNRNAKKITEFDRDFDSSGWGFWFAPNKTLANYFTHRSNAQPVFLNMKKPFDMSKGVDFDLIKRENLWFNHDMLDELEEDFLYYKTMRADALKELKKEGYDVIEFTHGGFFAWKNGRIVYKDVQETKSSVIKNKTILETCPNYADFYEFMYNIDEKNGRVGGIRNEYDILFELASDPNGRYGAYGNLSYCIRDGLVIRGYDGIIVDKDEFIIFDSTQAKDPNNKGAWVDDIGYPFFEGSTAKPTKSQIKEYDLKHRYFNPDEPNILMANGGEVLGSGFTFGTINGIEQDENGNITFNPQKFLNGFIYGAAGAKAVKLAIQKSPAIRAKAEKFAAKSAEFLNEALQNPLMLPQERARFAVVANKALNSALDNRKFIIGGEGAIGANREKLARARVMQKQGKDEGEIWDKTGWYLDKDGKWKFEINAAGGELNWDKMAAVLDKNKFKYFKLNEVLDDNALFNAYPQLKDFYVICHFLDKRVGAEMWFLEKKIVFNYWNAQTYLENAKITKSVIYHELQHAVQEIENFAKGGNMDKAFEKATPKQQKQLKKMQKEIDIDPYYTAYKRLHGEVEARNVQKRITHANIVDFWNSKPTLSAAAKKAKRKSEKALKSHPHKTQDVNIKDTIIYGQDGKAARQSIVERE